MHGRGLLLPAITGRCVGRSWDRRASVGRLRGHAEESWPIASTRPSPAAVPEDVTSGATIIALRSHVGVGEHGPP